MTGGLRFGRCHSMARLETIWLAWRTVRT